MPTLSPGLVEANLRFLLLALGRQRWNAPLSIGDISVLLSKRQRVSGEVAHAAVSAGFLVPVDQVYRLTPKGFVESRRLAAPTNTKFDEPDVVPLRSLCPARASPEIPHSVRLRHGDQTLRSLMANHGGSEEEILRAFAKGNQAALYFDPVWLQQNMTYQRLRAAGEL